MARKSIDVTIAEDNRDKGHTYRITEMPARDGEDWAYELGLILFRGGAITQEQLDLGMAGLASLAFTAILRGLGLINFRADVKPLLDRMLRCIEFVPDLRNPAIPPRPLLPEEPEEVTTLVHLRREWIALHLGFSSAGA